jgi:hypothetical protein
MMATQQVWLWGVLLASGGCMAMVIRLARGVC